MSPTSEAAPVTTPADSRVRKNGALALALFSTGHLCADMYSGALGGLQPLLVSRFGMSLADAGLLGGMLVFSSSLMQPAYGYLSDRLRTRLFAALGPALAGIFISSLGLAPSYGWLLLMVALGGASSPAARRAREKPVASTASSFDSLGPGVTPPPGAPRSAGRLGRPP